MDITASELFWKLIEEKGGIVPDTKKPVYTKECKPKEASWARFKTANGAIITMSISKSFSSACAGGSAGLIIFLIEFRNDWHPQQRLCSHTRSL